MHSSRSLAWYVALWAALAAAAAMTAYAVVQYVITPAATAGTLALAHGTHLLLVGLAVYVAVWALLQRLVVSPLRAIIGHLYGVATGRLEPLEQASRVREMEALVAGVNRMIRRMRMDVDPTALDVVQEDLMALRQMAHALHGVSPERADELLARTRRLQQALTTVMVG